MRAVSMVAVLLLAGCEVTVPSGRYACPTSESRCPPGQQCVDGLCVAAASAIDGGGRHDAGVDAGTALDAGRDASAPLDSGQDAGTDAGPPECTPLTAPDNGSVDRTTGVAGDVATYACEPGYLLTGNGGESTRTCQDDGSWSGSDPTCEPCVTKTCADWGNLCGNHPDGCGGVTACGACTLRGTDSASSPDRLIAIDPATGAGTALGSALSYSSTGLTYVPDDGLLYSLGGESTPATMYKVHPQTAAVTTVGSVGVLALGLAWDAVHDILYANDYGQSRLVTLNRSTGVFNVIGPYDLPDGTMSSDLAYDPWTETLYGVSGNTSTPRLYRIDTSTGQAISIGSLMGYDIRGLAFNTQDGKLYGVDTLSDYLVVLDTTSAAVTNIGPTGFGHVRGLAAIPGP